MTVARVASLDEALVRSEAYAPEHLELHVAEPAALLDRVRNAGSVFVGCSSVVGDYAAGATHVLPTGGLARSTGGLGMEMFLKPLQVVTATGEGVRREELLPGAILARVASSHIRVGTFQFLAARGDVDGLRALADHVIARHYPDAAHAERCSGRSEHTAARASRRCRSPSMARLAEYPDGSSRAPRGCGRVRRSPPRERGRGGRR